MKKINENFEVVAAGHQRGGSWRYYVCNVSVWTRYRADYYYDDLSFRLVRSV